MKARLAHPISTEAVVSTVIPLSAPQQDQIEQYIHSRWGPKTPIQFAQDPELIGGLKLRVGDLLYDFSLANALDQMTQGLKAYQL